MSEPIKAPIHRILGSAFYDGLISLGILMIAGAIAVGFNKLITGQDALDANLIYQLYLVASVVSYFVFFWHKSGQTVGMKAWRIKLVSEKSHSMSRMALVKRFLVAIPAYAFLLIGVLWQYLGSDNKMWHDTASQTYLIHIPKN